MNKSKINAMFLYLSLIFPAVVYADDQITTYRTEGYFIDSAKKISKKGILIYNNIDQKNDIILKLEKKGFLYVQEKNDGHSEVYRIKSYSKNNSSLFPDSII